MQGLVVRKPISLSYEAVEGQNPPFLGYCLPMVALVKDSGQFKQREKRLLKVVTVNLLLYKQLQYHKVVFRGAETLKRWRDSTSKMAEKSTVSIRLIIT
jgi:hypothetical protein